MKLSRCIVGAALLVQAVHAASVTVSHSYEFPDASFGWKS